MNNSFTPQKYFRIWAATAILSAVITTLAFMFINPFHSSMNYVTLAPYLIVGPSAIIAVYLYLKLNSLDGKMALIDKVLFAISLLISFLVAVLLIGGMAIGIGGI